MRALFGVSLFGVVALFGACGEAPDSGQGMQAREQEARGPEAIFSALEERLVLARDVEVDFHVTAEGAVGADLMGGLRISDGGVTEVTAEGRFAGQEVDLFLRSEGGRYEYGNGPDRISAPTPEHLDEALLIGLTRMGILHNLAMLVGNAPPDGADGGVMEWAVVEAFSLDEAEEARDGSHLVSFSMIVAGAPAGSAALEIGNDGSPVLRRQTVLFPSGEMRVVERYTRVRITP